MGIEKSRNLTAVHVLYNMYNICTYIDVGKLNNRLQGKTGVDFLTCSIYK